jgi:hypothetical protein
LPRAICSVLHDGRHLSANGAVRQGVSPRAAKLVLGECEFDRREIVLNLIEAFREIDKGTLPSS